MPECPSSHATTACHMALAVCRQSSSSPLCLMFAGAMYADLCLRLSKELPSFPPPPGSDKFVSFRQILLNTCQVCGTMLAGAVSTLVSALRLYLCLCLCTICRSQTNRASSQPETGKSGMRTGSGCAKCPLASSTSQQPHAHASDSPLGSSCSSSCSASLTPCCCLPSCSWISEVGY